ncbi:MAG: 2-polyprenyl-3-methyl-6-methoxy-1,4-benzoquinone monooxygenase [Usitatibacteraceae bacterium]
MNLVDRIICEVDTGMRTLFAKAHADRRPPGLNESSSDSACALAPDDRAESIRFMRINHCGEVCAQALYQGQALVAKDQAVQKLLHSAAQEERDHLAWCESRLAELGGRTTRLGPFFYAGAYGLGVVSGLLGDRWSMGFLVETERQVEAHLQDHLARVSAGDARSHAILTAMRDDEIRHGQAGLDQGATPLPVPIQVAMRGFSKVMTGTTYWI